MVFLFRQKSPGNLIILLIFGLLLKMPLFLYPRNTAATPYDEDLYHGFIHFISTGKDNAFVSSLVAFFLLYVQALMINYLMNEYRMLGKQTYLPGMAYLLVTTILPEWTFLSSPLVSLTFIIWVFILLFRLYNTQTAKGSIYNIGLLLGLSSYVYFPSATFILCALLGLMILKPFRLNEIVLLLMGCLTPYYFYGTYLFLTDQLNVRSFFPHLSLQVPQVKSNLWVAISTLFLTLPFLAGGFFVQTHLHKMLIQVRKCWSILLIYLLLAFFVPFVNSNLLFSNWILLAAPFACFHSAAYYYPQKMWVPHVLFVLLTGYILYLQYATPAWHTPGL